MSRVWVGGYSGGADGVMIVLSAWSLLVISPSYHPLPSNLPWPLPPWPPSFISPLLSPPVLFSQFSIYSVLLCSLFLNSPWYCFYRVSFSSEWRTYCSPRPFSLSHIVPHSLIFFPSFSICFQFSFRFLSLPLFSLQTFFCLYVFSTLVLWGIAAL